MTLTFSQYDSHKLATEFHDGMSFTHTIKTGKPGEEVVERQQWVRRKDDNIGTGSFGNVWRETCAQNGEVRAVKQIRKARWRNMLEELGALIAMSQYSENFVQFFGWFQDKENIYLAMEYVGCGDLKSLIEDSNGLQEPDVKSITAQLLDGLKIMHKHKLCHRDIKPENILVARWFPPTVKLGDFGISKRFGDDTKLHTQAGSDGYMAPEILDPFGETSIYTEAVDIWSLGCVVHKMITKDTPFQRSKEIFDYVEGKISFPSRKIKTAGSTATKFITNLMMPLAKDRLTAEEARADPWLEDDRSVTFWEEELLSPEASWDSKSQARTDNSTQISVLGPRPGVLNVEPRGLKESLLNAVSRGQNDRVRLLLDDGGDIMAKDNFGYELLAIAITMEHEDVATLLFEKGANNLSGNDGKSSLTSLHLATQQGDAELVRFLIKNGANLMSRTDEDYTPLHIATVRREMEIAKVLVGHGAEVNAATGSGLTSLHLAAATGNIELLRFLVENQADPMLRAENKFSALQIATQEKHIDVIQFLLAQGVDIDAATDIGLTSLHIASRDGSVEIANLLLNKGASPNLRTSEGYTPLHSAAQKGYTDLVQLLMRRGADALTIANCGCTPLHEAVKCGELQLVKFLLAEGANIEATAEKGYTPLHIATNYGHIELVRFLVMGGADVMSKDEGNLTALYIAAALGNTEMVTFLIEKGADVVFRNDKGETALHAAASGGHTNVIPYLWSTREDLMLRDTRGFTPLHRAAMTGHKEAFIFLLAAYGGGTDAIANIRTDRGHTSLHVAAVAGHKEVVLYLLEIGADIVARDDCGCTPLLLATREGCTEIVKLLHDRGADINTEGKEKYTPLHYAAQGGYTELVQFLLDEGADLTARTDNGSTPIMRATNNGHKAVIRLLVDWSIRNMRSRGRPLRPAKPIDSHLN